MKKILLTEEKSPLAFSLPNGRRVSLTWEISGSQAVLSAELTYGTAFGMGERFDGLNQKGKHVVNKVEEKFCFQGEKTYCPMPFFWTDSGFGLYVETYEITEFIFEEPIRIKCPADAPIFVFTGSPAQIISDYQSVTGGAAVLPPKWAFGPWISANRWNTQADVEAQLDKLKKYDFPASVLVIEAWSDEATFYIFNGAAYKPRKNGGALRYEDFDFSASPWPNPKAMIDRLHAEGIKLLLWQAPVYKKLAGSEPESQQNDYDREDAAARGLCVLNADGSAYTIPDGHWFPGSMVPDFSNSETVKAWFGKRKYLLDIGVDGFKTDGGEFIYDTSVKFSDGSDGRRGINRYAQSYVEAYANFVGDGRVLFSRAGGPGQHLTPVLWAGDQQSQNSELKGALSAGLSAALSAVPFWGFDIAGFAGSLPSPDLYRRATALAAFCPVVQWHSEPDGGQFRELMPGGEGNNERSPWNLADVNAAPELLNEIRFWHKLRMNMLPYIYSTALTCVAQGRPMMRPLVYDWHDDAEAVKVENQFMLGESLMVAPVLEENVSARDVYLPHGEWLHLFERKTYAGGRRHNLPCEARMPVFLKAGTGIALNLGDSKELGSFSGNRTDAYQNLHFILAGKKGEHRFRDDFGSDLLLKWHDGILEAEGRCAGAYTYEICNGAI